MVNIEKLKTHITSEVFFSYTVVLGIITAVLWLSSIQSTANQGVAGVVEIKEDRIRSQQRYDQKIIDLRTEMKSDLGRLESKLDTLILMQAGKK